MHETEKQITSEIQSRQKNIAHANSKINGSSVFERYHVQGEKLHIVYRDMVLSLQGHEILKNDLSFDSYTVAILLIY